MIEKSIFRRNNSIQAKNKFHRASVHTLHFSFFMIAYYAGGRKQEAGSRRQGTKGLPLLQVNFKLFNFK
jgi:hypothetical protein